MFALSNAISASPTGQRSLPSAGRAEQGLQYTRPLQESRSIGSDRRWRNFSPLDSFKTSSLTLLRMHFSPRILAFSREKAVGCSSGGSRAITDQAVSEKGGCSL